MLICRIAVRLGFAAGCVALTLWAWPVHARNLAEKQQSLAQWRTLTSVSSPSPRVFVKGQNVRCIFNYDGAAHEFKANWKRLRVPAPDYRVNSALLHLVNKPEPLPMATSGWREATVIAGKEWLALSTNLVAALAPETRGHGYYYQAIFADGLVYRDNAGVARRAPTETQPEGLVIKRRFGIEETLEILAREVEKQLIRTHADDSLFVIMPPGAARLTQPLLLDSQARQCVWLSPAALHDTTEDGLGITATAQGLGTLIFESHGLALLKNPVSSAFRLGDLGIQTAVRFLRRPLPRRQPALPAPGLKPGMDLQQWENWLDSYTGTRCQPGTMKLVVDGDRFFPRLKQAIAEATNHIHVNVYIFDRDDVAVGIADQLKARSADVDVKVIMDSMGTMTAALGPPATAMPPDFIAPACSMGAYLEQGSEVHARWFYNPWFSSDHSKVFLVDGVHAWIGGMNLGREYRYEWHDLMVELEGPVVQRLEEEFASMWAHAGPLGDLAYAATALHGPAPRTPPGPGHNMQLRILPTKTAWKPFSTAVLASLRKAQNHVYVEHPYLFDKRVLSGLVQARRRGVDVRVILPRVNDFKAARRSNLVTANYLLEHGVRVFFYPGMTHAKALLVDDWACLGSANLNHLSMRLCQEQNVATSDAEFARRLKRDLFEQDFERSHELTEPLSVGWVDFLVDLVLESF